MTSRAIERALEAFEIDAGVTYLENEPLQHVRKVPLYHERYVFVARRGHPATANATITWKEAAAERLCLLSEDMQNRRIINNVAASIGVDIKPTSSATRFSPFCRTFVTATGRASFPTRLPGCFWCGRSRRRRPGGTDSHASDRPGFFGSEPLSPMGGALFSSIANVDFERDLDTADVR